ncbi:hypothetical protein BDN70DRAFT_880830 [Pholiota conissans]|uniref:Arrestin-like N-terminal domain-containing protein n=1 Tax=Pholiota conissans TaxID=109636 RepID=A0A9P6CSU7_9AGAR|nr:hypothetical protein BDN70DRAFT_880830 [Pholiota conissans]
MAASQALPEPMNSQPHHSKVKVSITLADPTFVAGTHVAGKLEMECRADKGLGIGIMMVELFAIQELSSRDHSATSTFLHSRRLFQGPTLPPSNAVQAHPMPGDPPLPQHYYHARRGHSTFLFRIPIPPTSPSSISFGPGLAKVRYELRASVGVFWKNERRLVVDKRPIDVVEAYPYEEIMGKIPEAIVVGENGKLWMQGKIVGSVIVAGESAYLELQVKNHSGKKNTGLTLTLSRTLYLPGSSTGQNRGTPVHISDTLITVPFRGAEYIIPPGAEGVANLVFDVPKHARGVRGGTLDGEELEGGHGLRHSDSLFEIRCKVEVKLTMGMGSKDIILDVPVEVVHPRALPPPQEAPGPFSQQYTPSEPMANPAPYPDYNPYYAARPISPSPLPMAYIDPIHNQIWLPPPPIPPQSPLGYPYLSQSPATHEHYQPVQLFGAPQAYYASPTLVPPQQTLLPPLNGAIGHGGYPPRPSSAGPIVTSSQAHPTEISGLPAPLQPASLLPLPQLSHQSQGPPSLQNMEPQAGKGERAFRVTQHLRMSSRNRSVSPQSHRYPLAVPPMATLNESHVQDSLNSAAPAGASAPFNGGELSPTNILSPPLLLPNDAGISPSSPEDQIVHSPRPQLTPKHSFTRDPVLGDTVKSERVEELEKMADAVGRKSRDLSCDLPKGVDLLSITATKAKEEKDDLNMNKTLPGPPVPSGKLLTPLPGRARADLYFASDNNDTAVPETTPLPSDQTPPTPALLAVLPSRHRAEKNELQTESGLDALERRLLAEVGTRKMDIRHIAKDQRPDVRNVLPIDTSVSPLRTASILIPQKSPEPLHDSAISSLTLAGGLAGDESDGEFDGRTHRAGRSGGGSSDGRGEARGGLHMHMRERARAGTPTRDMEEEREHKEGEKGKERKTSGKKKDRTSNKSAAKGRVAAWLGGIHPDVPPQEQIIPPSPSVLRNPHSPFELEDDESSSPPNPLGSEDPWAAPLPEPEPEVTKDTTAPNPRSSGFVPIATLKRNTIHPPPLLLRDTSVSEEARRVQDIWSSSPPAVYDFRGPKTPLAITPIAPPLSIRTDRRVSPPSAKPTPTMPAVKPNMPLSYSAAARSKPKTPEPPKVRATSPLPPPLPPPKAPVASPPRNGVHSIYPPRQPPSLPPKPSFASPPRGRTQISYPPQKPVDVEVKYDIRSARGGRGGKVTAVANLWSSGAINSNANGKGKEIPKPANGVEDTKTSAPLPAKPLRTERKLFSAAVMTPAPPLPKRVPNTSDNATSKPPKDAQKRPDARAVFASPSRPIPASSSRSSPGPKKSVSSNALSTPTSGGPSGLNLSRKSSEALVQKRPATALAKPFALSKPTPTTNLSTSNSSEQPLQSKVAPGFAARALKPVIKASSDPAVVSSSHAVPTLSTTASLARPQISGPQKSAQGNGRPVKLPAVFSTPSTGSLVGTPSEVPRPASPSKPVDLVFGQARLKDLIKKYQGQVQKT